MFSSLASYIFGSNSPTTTNPDNNLEPQNKENNLIATDDRSIGTAIPLTSCTPSVAGANTPSTALTNIRSNDGRPGKNKNKNHKNHHHNNHNVKKRAVSPVTAKAPLTPVNVYDNFEEDDWILIEKENFEEEELPLVESIQKQPALAAAPKAALIEKPIKKAKQSLSHHSSYSEHRPQPLRNRSEGALNSALVPTRNLSIAGDGGCTQSLYVVPSSTDADEQYNKLQLLPAKMAMEESWFLTPPPCFTSTGPINMEISPFENLLIEHPSMSVYHSIRTAVETSESFINIDLGAEESQQLRFFSPQQSNRQLVVATVSQVPQPRVAGRRADRFSSAQIKQEIMERSTQKSLEKQKRQSLCRSAIERSNKVRDFNSNCNRLRRSDMQNSRIISRANNNRKC